ncbi:MAG: chemotaxis protein CheW [Thermodesulfobacteriota bacterium]
MKCRPDTDEAAVLEKRAKILARSRRSHKGEKTEDLDFVEFILSNEAYGLELKHIREIYPLQNLTVLPGLPPFILGIINVRGTIVSVVDLKKLFHLPDSETGQHQYIIILAAKEMAFGVLADEIIGVKNTAFDQLQPPCATLTGVRDQYLKGIADSRIALLDGKRLLEDESLVIKANK